MLYCYPKFVRGAGLGNRLFTWARCRLFAKENDAAMISPLWFRLAISQFFRGGVGYSSYLNQVMLYDLFGQKDGDVSWAKGLWLRRSLPVISEHEFVVHAQPEDIVVLFDGNVCGFKGLNGWNGFLLNELRNITLDKRLRIVDGWGDVPVGINIRCGNDFKPAPEENDFERVGWLQKTPIRWFVDTLEFIRKHCGYPVKAVVVSDGTESQLSEILAVENVHFLRPGTAISDLLVLSKSKVLLASGSSTFSAWASFLGQMPTITAPGHPMTNWGLKPTSGQYIGEFRPQSPEPVFVDEIDRLFCGDSQADSNCNSKRCRR